MCESASSLNAKSLGFTRIADSITAMKVGMLSLTCSYDWSMNSMKRSFCPMSMM